MVGNSLKDKILRLLREILFVFKYFINIFYHAIPISKVIVDKLLVYHNNCNS